MLVGCSLDDRFVSASGEQQAEAAQSSGGSADDSSANDVSGSSGASTDPLGGGASIDMGESVGGAMVGETGSGASDTTSSPSNAGESEPSEPVVAWPPPFQRRLAVGTQQGCVIRQNGSLLCWGEPVPSLPSLEVVPAGSFPHLSVELVTACAVSDRYEIVCWGDTEANSQPAPVGTFVMVDVGVRVSCGLLPDGSAFCWGQDAAAVQLPNETYLSVGAGRGFACGLTNQYALHCSSGIDAPPSDGPFLALSVSEGHACALRADRTLACWGLGGPDDPTDGSDELGNSWGQAIPPTGEFARVAVGTVHSCALREDGEAVCWGAGKTIGDCALDVDGCGMSLPPAGPFIELALGYTHTCGLRPDGSVTCWGSNTGDRSTPPSGVL